MYAVDYENGFRGLDYYRTLEELREDYEGILRTDASGKLVAVRGMRISAFPIWQGPSEDEGEE